MYTLEKTRRAPAGQMGRRHVRETKKYQLWLPQRPDIGIDLAQWLSGLQVPHATTALLPSINYDHTQSNYGGQSHFTCSDTPCCHVDLPLDTATHYTVGVGSFRIMYAFVGLGSFS